MKIFDECNEPNTGEDGRSFGRVSQKREETGRRRENIPENTILPDSIYQVPLEGEF